MSFFEIFLIGCGLAMDAFAVSICKGMATQHVSAKHMCIAGLWFGGFQMLMPLAGYFLGSTFARYIQKYDHWIAFCLLSAIGVNMIVEAVRGKEDEEAENNSFAPLTMFLMAIATSIDALAVGVTFAFLNVSIWSAVGIIGIVTFAFSADGVKIGSVFGGLFRSKAEIAGGIILIIIGLRILLSHLGIIN